MLNHEARKRSIGASEIAAILECNENMSPLDVWLVKTGRKPPFEGNEHTRRGNRQEAQILEWLAEDLGCRIATDCPSIAHEGGLATATPDGFVVVPKVEESIMIEHWSGAIAKSDAQVLWELRHDIDFYVGLEIAEAKSTLKTINSVEDIPATWLIQCQWQMLCTGLKKAHLAIFGPMVSNYQRFEIEYNEKLAFDLLAQAEQWWETHIVGDKEPEPMNEADILLLYPQSNGRSMEAVPELYDAICKMNELKSKEKDCKDAIEEIRQRVVLAIKPFEVVKYGGRWIASYKTNTKGSRTLRTL